MNNQKQFPMTALPDMCNQPQSQELQNMVNVEQVKTQYDMIRVENREAIKAKYKFQTMCDQVYIDELKQERKEERLLLKESRMIGISTNAFGFLQLDIYDKDENTLTSRRLLNLRNVKVLYCWSTKYGEKKDFMW